MITNGAEVPQLTKLEHNKLNSYNKSGESYIKHIDGQNPWTHTLYSRLGRYKEQ